jgi:hypothetical protein
MDTRAAMVLVLLAAPACGPSGGWIPGRDDSNSSMTLRDRLREASQDLELKPELSRIDVTARMGDDNVRTQLVMLHGATSLSAEDDGTLVVDELIVAVDDVILHHDLLPENGLHLMNIEAHLDAGMAARTTWVSDDELHAETTGDLVVEWAVMNPEGNPAKLAPQPVRGIPFDIQVVRDERAEIETTLAGRMDGVFWSWADYVSLSDLAFSLTSGIAEETDIVQ